MAGRNTVTPQVLKYLMDNHNLPVWVNEAAKYLGLTEDQVAQSVYRLITLDTDGAASKIEVIQAAHCWRWVEHATTATGILYEQITVTKAGVILVQDEDGKIYKLTAL